ncbi:MAG TPA: hypothetical protein VHG91_04505 [Longimicrobium sp.]|nr:hypothetical protein [Longimicrobium sp.]
MPAPASAACPRNPPLLLHPYFATALMLAAAMATSALLEGMREAPVGARAAVALVPVLPAAYLVWTMARYIRGLDELQRKIQADSLALAYTAAILLAVALNYLGKAGVRLPLGWEDGWGLLVMLYAAAHALTLRRYR